MQQNFSDQDVGQFKSPGGFVFGVQGFSWGDQKPSSITFFLDGTCKVSDQHGRPIKGIVKEGKAIYFEKCTHQQVIAALYEERVDWTKLPASGWPQLPYSSLKELREIPPTPIAELRKIKDDAMRRDALRMRREVDAAKEKEFQGTDEADE